MVSSKAGDFQEEHERELQIAVDEAEERATRELRAALKRLSQDKEEEKSKALKNQKEVGYMHLPSVSTLSQTTNLKIFQTERVCRQQFQIWRIWLKVLQKSIKHCEKREKGEMARNKLFLLSPSVFKRLVLQTGHVWERVDRY